MQIRDKWRDLILTTAAVAVSVMLYAEALVIGANAIPFRKARSKTAARS